MIAQKRAITAFGTHNLAAYAAPQRFPVGTQFKPLGKHAKICTVTDFLTTRNLAGEIVSTRYVATHEFCGQLVTDKDVCEATIARGNPH